MRLFLVGLPGSGKSTIGKALAKKLAFDFIDMDERIVQSEGKSIEAIFKEDGEDHFRKAEQKTLLRLSTTADNAIISTGGGAPCFFNNMDVINEAGISIYLNPPLGTILERLEFDKKNKRPLIEKKSKEERAKYIQEKFQERNPYYERARIQFKEKDITADQILESLKAQKIL